MTSSFLATKVVKEKEVLNVHLISNEIKQPNFRAIPDIAYKQDLSYALLMISSQVLMIQDV